MRKFPYKAFKTFHCHHLLHMAKSSVSQAVRLTGSLLKTALIWLIFSTGGFLHIHLHWHGEQSSLWVLAGPLSGFSVRPLCSNSVEFCASANEWWKPGCTPAGPPIKPQCLRQLSQRNSNRESRARTPLFRCLPEPVNFVDSVRCKETPRAHGRLRMAHNAAFHQLHLDASSLLNPAESW